MDNKWNVYPRPQLRRNDWLNLNGEWNFGSSTINVPFCPESTLSGVGRRITPDEIMVYERIFRIPEAWRDVTFDRRILLHFGAVDQIATVYVNDIEVGKHEGGYLPFTIDITEAVGTVKNKTEDVSNIDWSEDNPDISLRVEVIDSLDHKYPWGKQKNDNGGMWYTPVSGIWQSVWAESVPETHVTSLKIDSGKSSVDIRAYGIESGTLTLLGKKYTMVKDEESEEISASIHIDIDEPHNWSPEDPYLYDFIIDSGRDHVESYFALRTITIEERDGFKRICLNGEPYFFNGLLDQGYWQDGIYTPESPDAYAKDILAMKSLGFNTLRKHIKIEPEQYYYDCDRLGMVVFQDMVNNGKYSFIRDTVLPTVGIRKLGDKNRNRNEEARKVFLDSMDETVKYLYNHPSICYWTIFNEGWGQFEADSAYDRLKAIDDSRIVDSTSGWFMQTKSDVDSHHVYFKEIKLEASDKPLVLSEFGGYACKLPNHCYNKDKTYGYKKCENEGVLLHDIVDLYTKEVLPMVDKGLCAAIYTQLSDVEDETNGILTYDREVLKFKSYIGTGRIEIIGNHTDHQGGRVMVAPSPHKIKAYVADNHRSVIRVCSEGFEPFEVSITGGADFKKGTTEALVTGVLDGFADLYGKFDGENNGFDVYIKSEVPVGSGLSSSAAFEILMCRIINDRYFGSKADAVQMAKIAMFAEREYYGKPCGMMDQLAIALGKLAMIDFNGKEPEIELIDFDFEKAGLDIEIVPTEADHAALDDEYAAVPGDMFKVAEALGVSRLGDINEEQFKRKLPELNEKVKKGELTELQVNRATHYFDENERVLAAAIALKMGNVDRFLQCINMSGLSSETLLKNVVPRGVKENDLSRTIHEYRAKEDTAAVRLIGGGFGGSVLVFKRK